MVPHFPGASPRQWVRIKRDDSIGAIRHLGSWAPRRTAVAACCVIMSLVAGLATGGGGVPAAQADPPDPKAQKRQLDAQIKASMADLHESYNRLQATAIAYQQASGQLAAVQKRYAAAQGELAAARAADVAAARRLEQAEAALAIAEADVVTGEQLITASRQDIGKVVRATYQQHNNLISMSIVLRGSTPSDLATGYQVRRNVFDVQSNALSKLRDAQAQLASRQAKVAEAQRIVAAQRAEAAETVRRVAETTAAVAAQKVEVTRSTQAKLRAFYAMANQRAAELNRYYALVNERNRVARILIARARAEKAAALKRRADAIRKGRPVPPSWGSEVFIRPVDTYITSPYGMRFHPILRYWKLHDGTDFGGDCGMPIRAAAGGVVTDKYYNGGYGKRLFVSHGIQRGSHLVSVYNHLSSYSAYVGQRVRKGDVIGYVGTTGYSTGCHLHFMIYQDGRTVNPMRWL